jgi:hypothetical protein
MSFVKEAVVGPTEIPVLTCRLDVVIVPAMVGEVARTGPPEPVAALLSPVATPAPSPEMPVETGRPVAFVNVADDGVPSAGVTRVGEVDSTGEPEPVTAFARPAATPVPRPDTPVEIGSPVAFVNVAEEGVPRAGAVSVGDVDSTTEPDPVDVLAPVPPCGIDNGVVSPESEVMLLFAPAVAPLELFNNVPLVGSVTLVDPVVVITSGLAPEVVRFPPSVIVLEFATPVPPLDADSGF